MINTDSKSGLGSLYCHVRYDDNDDEDIKLDDIVLYHNYYLQDVKEEPIPYFCDMESINETYAKLKMLYPIILVRRFDIYCL